MTSIDLDDYIPEEESEAPPPMSLFQHLYQSPPAAAVAPPPPARLPAASMRADNDKQPGPRFKYQARPAPPLQPATVPSVIREATIPMASALLVPESQIEREHRVQSEMERQLDLERQQLELRRENIDLDRQRLELVERQQQLRERQELQQDPQLKLEQQQRQQLEEQLELQRQVLEQLLGVANQLPQQQPPPPPATTNEQQQQQQEPTTVAENGGSGSKKRWIGRTIVAAIVVCSLAGGGAAAFVGICGTSGNCRGPQSVPTTTATMSISTTTRSSSIRSYINNITLTGRSFRYPNNSTAEERALLWLIDVDRSTTGSDLVILRQRYALATLWFQTPMGFGSSGWATGITECDWYGVSCDAAGRLVTSLDLRFDGVEGHILADLGLLTALTYLDLGANALMGTIPTTIAALTSLTFLGLFSNALNGTIPSLMGSLTALTYLSLSRNALTGSIPTTITTLTDLTDLLLYNNGLMGTMPFCVSVPDQSFSQLVVDCNKVGCPCCTGCCPTYRDGIPVPVFC